jgi:hypothetical protein
MSIADRKDTKTPSSLIAPVILAETTGLNPMHYLAPKCTQFAVFRLLHGAESHCPSRDNGRMATDIYSSFATPLVVVSMSASTSNSVWACETPALGQRRTPRHLLNSWEART